MRFNVLGLIRKAQRHLSFKHCWLQWCNKAVSVNLEYVIGLRFSVSASKFCYDRHLVDGQITIEIKINVKAIFTGFFFLQKCVTEERYNDDDDGVETTGVGPGGASAAAASPLLHVHGSFGAVATSVFLTA